MFVAFLIAVISVIDGDTIDIDGVRVRLHGIDTPEIRRPACPAESALGREAKAFVEGAMATDAAVDFEAVQKHPDRYGRTVARVTINDEDLGDLLIAAGFAAKWDYDGGAPKPEWCSAGSR